MTFALIVSCLVNVALVALSALRDRDRDTALANILAAAASANSDHVALVDRLCQRIQAPEAAIVEHHALTAGASPEAPLPDDDEAFWKGQDIGTAELAGLALAQEIADRDAAQVA